MADENVNQASEAPETTLSDDARSALEDKVSAAFSSMETGDAPESEEPEITETAEIEVSAETDDNSVETDESGTTDNSVEEESDAGTVEDQPSKSSTPTIPAAYRRSLKAYDWTDEEIDEAYKANPAAFLSTAQRIHSNRNAEVAKWAELGRSTRKSGETAPKDAPRADSGFDPASGRFKPIDVDGLIEKHGNEDLVREIAEPMNRVLEQINSILPDLTTGVQAIQQSRQQALGQQIEQFFGGDELKPFAELYGTGDSLEEQHYEARNRVLEMADALIAGAAQQGRKLSVTDAMTLAHDSVSGGFKAKAARQEIRGKVQKRAASVTLKPTSAGKKPSGPPKNAQELETRTRSRLAAVFGS